MCCSRPAPSRPATRRWTSAGWCGTWPEASAPEYARRSVQLDPVGAPRTSPAIPADADGLVQVLLNLLHNALAATSPGGRVEIGATTAVRDGRPGVALAVADTGTGISPDHI